MRSGVCVTGCGGTMTLTVNLSDLVILVHVVRRRHKAIILIR